jgi:hypothetical protein
MAMSVNPAIEGSPWSSLGQSDPVAMIGPRSTVPIKASGYTCRNSKAAHMTATGRHFHARAKKSLAKPGAIHT